jgi:hypothetical protein
MYRASQTVLLTSDEIRTDLSEDYFLGDRETADRCSESHPTALPNLSPGQSARAVKMTAHILSNAKAKTVWICISTFA